MGVADTCTCVGVCSCVLTQRTIMGRYVAIVAIFVWAMMPVWQLYGPAVISTSTLKLLNQLNELRTCCYDPEDAFEFSARAARLVEYLHDTNSRRGPGFVMFGIVINLLMLVRANTSMIICLGLVNAPQSLWSDCHCCTFARSATSGAFGMAAHTLGLLGHGNGSWWVCGGAAGGSADVFAVGA